MQTEKKIMNEIKQVRLNLGWTQRQMAEALCVTVRCLQRWEAGDRKCPPGMIKLAKMVESQSA